MGIYNSAVITNTGQALLAQSVAGNDLKFTTVKTSNYTYPSGTSLADLTTLTGIKQSKNITGANVYNSRVIKVSAMVDNAGVTAEYSINTIGVYATVGTAAEQLFAVITAQEADKMPAFNSRPYSYIYDLNMTMQGAANITVTVNNAGFVNINDLNNALDGVNDSITDLDETVNGRIDTLSSSVDTSISALNDALSSKVGNNQGGANPVTFIQQTNNGDLRVYGALNTWKTFQSDDHVLRCALYSFGSQTVAANTHTNLQLAKSIGGNIVAAFVTGTPNAAYVFANINTISNSGVTIGVYNTASSAVTGTFTIAVLYTNT